MNENEISSQKYYLYKFYKTKMIERLQVYNANLLFYFVYMIKILSRKWRTIFEIICMFAIVGHKIQPALSSKTGVSKSLLNLTTQLKSTLLNSGVLFKSISPFKLNPQNLQKKIMRWEHQLSSNQSRNQP